MSTVLPFRPAATPPTPHTVELILKPVAGRPGRFDVVDNTGRTVTRSRQPTYAGARALLAEGMAPDTLLQVRHTGSPYIAMSGKLADLARWSVSESDRSGLRRVEWQPYPAASANGPAKASPELQDGRHAIADLSVVRAARRAPRAPRGAVATISRRIAA